MYLKPSTATANGAANGTGLKEQFTACFLYLFAGPVPDTADEALDMVADHTQVCKITESNDGVTSLNFDTPVAGLLSKAAAEDWAGTATFSGVDAADPSLVPTFYRLCSTADTGRTLANSSTGYRLQGTVGGPSSGADLILGSASITAAAVQPIDAFGIRVGAP